MSIHDHVRSRIRLAITEDGIESIGELAKKAKVPRSTLYGQLSDVAIDLDVLWKVAKATKRPIGWFFPVDEIPKSQAEEVLRKVREALELNAR